MDDDAVTACADLVGRTGARRFEIGYLHDNVPASQAGWYAFAQYKGTRIIAGKHRGPAEAADALSRRLLTGGLCEHCNQIIRISGITGLPGCRWRRMGPRWEPGCD